MKRKVLLIVFMLLTLCLTSCKSEEKKEEKKPITKQEEKINISERKQRIINLIKTEMINQNHMLTDNIKTLDITKVYLYGYYSETGKKDFEIGYTYSCQSEENCIKGLNSEPNTSNTIWINMDSEETKIYSINTGISISASDINSKRYLRIGELVE